MRKMLRVLGLTMVVVAILAVTIAGTVSANSGPLGPNPDAGDGVSDGSSLQAPNGPNGDVGSGSRLVGPAPNSGDSVPGGSGF